MLAGMPLDHLRVNDQQAEAINLVILNQELQQHVAIITQVQVTQEHNHHIHDQVIVQINLRVQGKAIPDLRHPAALKVLLIVDHQAALVEVAVAIADHQVAQAVEVVVVLADLQVVLPDLQVALPDHL